MGCGISTNTADEPTPDAALVVRRYLKKRDAREPGYLARDPSSLSHYKLLLLQEGAESRSDEDDDILRAARDITVVLNHKSDEATSSCRSSIRRMHSRHASFYHNDHADMRSSSSTTLERHVSFAMRSVEMPSCADTSIDDFMFDGQHPCSPCGARNTPSPPASQL